MCAVSAKPVSSGWGLTRRERLRPALAPEYISLDERGGTERMAMARRYAHLLEYTSLSGQDGGDWSPFLASDTSFLMAEIALAADVAPGRLDELHSTVRRLDGWYRELEQQNSQMLTRALNPVFTTLGQQISQHLGPALQGLLSDPQLAAQWQTLDKGRGPMSPVWENAGGASGSVSQAQAGALFEEAGRQLAQAARHALVYSLTQNDHPPHTGLYLAFLRLLDVARHDLNRFTARYLDYYYREVLGMARKGAEADTALVVVGLAPTCASLTLPAGTQFKAGQDANGKTIVYASEQDTVLSQASVAAISTLCLVRGSDGMVSQACAAPVADSQDGLGAPLQNPQNGWPTFGAPPAAGAPSLDAELGLVIAAPALALAEGTRTVTLDLQFGSNGDTQAQAYLQAGAPSLAVAFTLGLSGAKDWFAPAGGFTLSNGATPNQWQLKFTLQPGENTLTANPALLPGLASPWPMLKLCLNPAAPVYAYSYFQPLQLSALDITVQVQGLTALQIANGGGPVAAGKPFPAFGNAPLPGQYLLLAHPELSTKAVSQATVHLTWMNLPLANPSSTPPTSTVAAYTFADYYAGYTPYVFNDTIFTAGAAAYAAGAWTPLAAVPTDGSAPSTPAPLVLFTDTIAGTSTYTLDLSPLAWSYADAVQSLSQPASATPRATLQLSFAAPAYGFGSAIFPNLFAEKAIASVKGETDSPSLPTKWWNWIKSLFGKSDPPAGVTLPNPPFVPMLKSVALDYTASESVALVAAAGLPPQCCQLTPFGYALNTAPAPTLFPVEADDGHLYLGIDGAVAGQALNLHLELREASTAAVTLVQGQVKAVRQAVCWRWLAANGWVDVPAASVTSHTSDFGGSGIVTLNLPAALDTGNTVMAAGLFWLEARVARDAQDYPRTVAILSQALTAKRQLSDGATGVPHPLPAGSITAPLTPQTAIKSVSQPYPGQGGAPAETEARYRARVSERLRHKQRASQGRDYEQLALDAFPKLWQAKCVGVNNSRGYDSQYQVPAGQIVLAVAGDGSAAPQLAPPVSSADLGAIACALQAASSPTIASICVRNLSYESLLVSVAVQFQPGADVVACSKQLNSALCEFLSPQPPYPARLDIGSGCIQVDQVAALVRAQSYVAQAGPVTIAQSFMLPPPQDAPLPLTEGQAARARAPWSVLVTAPQHAISLLDGGTAPAPAAVNDADANAGAAPTYVLSIPFDMTDAA